MEPLAPPVADHQKATHPSRRVLPKSRGLLAGVHVNGPTQFNYSMDVLRHFQVAPAVAMFGLASSMEALRGQPRHSIHIQTLTFCSTYHRRSNGIGLRHRSGSQTGPPTAGQPAHVPSFCSLMMIPKKFSGSPLIRWNHGRQRNSAP